MEKSNPDPHIPPFILLGHDQGAYYYLSKGSGQVVELSAEHHVMARLLRLAGLQWWEQEHSDKGTINWKGVANTLIQKNHEVVCPKVRC